MDIAKISGNFSKYLSTNILILPFVILMFQLATLACFSQFVAACMSGTFRTNPSDLLCYTLGVIFLGLMFYVWDVICNVYRDMKKQQNDSPIYVTMQLYFLEARRPDSQEFSARLPVGLKLGLV